MIFPKEVQIQRKRVQTAADVLLQRSGLKPKVALLLGTGHAEFHRRLTDRVVLTSEELPEFPQVGEDVTIVLGRLDGLEVLVSDAPLAPYLGLSGFEIAFPVRVFRAAGAEYLVLSAAAAALGSSCDLGDLGLISDHLNFSNVNPLLGANDKLLGPRFPDMTEPYDAQLAMTARSLAIEAGFPLREGVFAAIQGPSLPTRAEYRFLHDSGADFVGMSTVPEVIAAVHAGFKTLALLGITQCIDPNDPEPTSLESMVDAADLAAPRMVSLLSGILEKLSQA